MNAPGETVLFCYLCLRRKLRFHKFFLDVYIYIYIYIYIYEISNWIGPCRDVNFLRFIYLFRSYIRVCFHFFCFRDIRLCEWGTQWNLNSLVFEWFSFLYGFISGKRIFTFVFLYSISKVRSSDQDTDYFDIVIGALQGDTQAPYFFIISLDYVLWTSIDKMNHNCFKLAKERSRIYPAPKNYGRELHRWHSASGKCTRPSQNPATLPWTSRQG